MMKRALSLLLVLVLVLGMLPVTAGAVSSGKRIRGSQPYTTDYVEYEPNNTRELADWFNANDAYVDGEVGQVSAGDYYDWFCFELDRDYRLYFWGSSGAGGCNTTRFKVYDASGSLVKTIDYSGEDPHDPYGDDYSDDLFFSVVDLKEGKYYIQVSDSTYWVDYSFETTLIAMFDTPVLSVSNRVSDGKPSLSWNADTEVIECHAHYAVQRATSKNGTYSTIATVTGDVNSYVDTSAKVGTTYYYRVIAESTVVFIPSFPSNVVSRTCDLPRPTNVKDTRSASTGKVTVSWSKVTGADKYSVYYSVDGGSTYSLLKTVTGTSLTHSSAPVGKAVYYKVKAVYSANTAANSAYSSYTKGTATLAAPSISVSNVASTGKIKVSWNAVSGAAKYTVYIYDASGNLLKSTSTSGTSLTHSSAVAGTTYTYKVRAIGSVSAANSSYSAAKDRTCDLAAPTLSVSTASGKPKLTWTKVSGADKYDVYYSTDGSSWSKLKTVTGTSLTHSSATAGKTYYYRVRAVCSANSSANSAWSGSVKVKVPGSTSGLAAPSLTVAANTAGKPKLTWTKVTGATQYKVYYSVDGGANWTLLKTMTGTSLTHTSAQKGVTYSYKVRAVNASTNSAYSNLVSITSK